MEDHQRFVVTAWRNRQELLQLRHDLYSSDTVRREKALNKVNISLNVRLGGSRKSVQNSELTTSKVFAWRLRKHDGLPLLLDSTVDIIDVIIQDEKGQLKHNALRLLYAAGISRFVTGLADTQIELIRDRPAWFPPGKCLQVPLDLLEIRHRIVHRHLPSLVELKRAAKDSLDWLWEWYWSQLDYAFSVPQKEDDAVPLIAVKDSLNVILKIYVKERKSEIKTRQKDSKAADTASSSYKLQFAPNDVSAPTNRIQSCLLKLLIDEKMMLPTDRKLGSSMSGAFLIWNPFLLTLRTSHLRICPTPTLLGHLTHAMNAPSMFQQAAITKELDPVREGLHEWVIHILTSDEWKPARGEQEHKVIQDVLTVCFSEPTFWNLKLATGLLDKCKVPDYEQWHAVLTAATSAEQGDVERHAETVDGNSQVGEQGLLSEHAREKELENGEQKEKLAGPRKFEGMWKPKPIGWLPEGWEDW